MTKNEEGSTLKLEVGVRYTKVITQSDEILRSIDERFAVDVPGRWFAPAFKEGHWDGKVHYFNQGRQRLPTGLLPRLRKFLATNHQYKNPNIVDHRLSGDYPDPVLQLGGFDLTAAAYDYQAVAVKESLAAQRGVLELATNAGKTIVAASIIETLRLPTLFICGTRDIVFQTEAVFKGALSERDIAVLGAGHKDMGMVTICTIQALHRLVKMRLTDLLVFEVVFFDECHHSSSDTWFRSGMALGAPWRFGLSGTAFDGTNDKDYRLISVTGERIKGISNAELIERGVSAVPTVTFHASASSGSIPFKTDYNDVVRFCITQNEARNKQICDLAQAGGGCVLILTPRTQHAQILWEMLKDRDVTVWYNHGRIPPHFRQKNLQDFRKGGVMVATSIYDEGIDVPEVSTLILALGGRSKRKVLQRIGRALRKKQRGDNTVDVVDFYDPQHPYLRSHSCDRLRIYQAEGFKVEAGCDDSKLWMTGLERSARRRLVRKTKKGGGKHPPS